MSLQKTNMYLIWPIHQLVRPPWPRGEPRPRRLRDDGRPHAGPGPRQRPRPVDQSGEIGGGGEIRAGGAIVVVDARADCGGGGWSDLE